MTLIIGVKCGDGVVVGADSTATYAVPLGGNTVQQDTNKIEIKQDSVILGTSGPIGLSQLMVAEIENQWGNILRKRSTNDARQEISKSLWIPIKKQIERAQVFGGVVGNQNAFQSVACLTVVALPIRDQPMLAHFDFQCASEEATESLPFVTIGSGQAQADPFLAFIKRVIWDNKAPRNIADGIFGVLWTLQHVIKVNAGHGVGGHPKIAVLEKQGEKWESCLLSNDRLDEHKQAISAAESALKSSLSFNPES